MVQDYLKLEADLAALLAELPAFSDGDVQDVERFIDAGQYGVALEAICTAIVNKSIVLGIGTRQKIDELGARMKTDPWTIDIHSRR